MILPKNIQRLADAVVRLALVDDLEEHALDRPVDEGTQGHELAVDAVQDRLQVVTLVDPCKPD